MNHPFLMAGIISPFPFSVKHLFSFRNEMELSYFHKLRDTAMQDSFA